MSLCDLHARSGHPPSPLSHLLAMIPMVWKPKLQPRNPSKFLVPVPGVSNNGNHGRNAFSAFQRREMGSSVADSTQSLYLMVESVENCHRPRSSGCSGPPLLGPSSDRRFPHSLLPLSSAGDAGYSAKHASHIFSMQRWISNQPFLAFSHTSRTVGFILICSYSCPYRTHM